MQIYTPESFKENNNKPCVTVLGNFDGVHKGHAELIRKAKAVADENGYLLCVYTFSEHPSNFKGGVCGLLTTNDEKAQLIEKLGADILYTDCFDAVKDMSCEDFCRDILVSRLGTKIAVCGTNYRFGRCGMGDASTLKSEMESLGAKAFVEELKTENGSEVSSTAIRTLIAEGKTVEAKRLLGRAYSFGAKVVHGRHLATQLGAPTINQTFPKEKIVPKKGVYAAYLSVDGKGYMGVANVGTKPTVTSDEKDPPVICETHIINYKGDLYGKYIKTEFHVRLRDEKKFSSLTELSEAIKKNVEETLLYFGSKGDVTKDE